MRTRSEVHTQWLRRNRHESLRWDVSDGAGVLLRELVGENLFTVE